ncbi:MAG TPA: hypothetical protein VM891_06560 [Amaricoccus sp.]|nr:hypothetical protein [Amaricoccus sp.]
MADAGARSETWAKTKWRGPTAAHGKRLRVGVPDGHRKITVVAARTLLGMDFAAAGYDPD